MKKYIAPDCEMMILASSEMLATSFKVDPETNTSIQLSNQMLDAEWDEE